MGRGPITGWGRGICGETGRRGQVIGRGGGGGGWGRRNRFRATGADGGLRGQRVLPAYGDAELTIDAELRWLSLRAAELKAEQQRITGRLEELDQKRTD